MRYKKKIKSPYNDGVAILKSEIKNIRYKNKTIKYNHFYYEDVQTNLKFTTVEIGDRNIKNIKDEYKIKVNKS